MALYPILMKYILIILWTVEFEFTEDRALPIVVNIYQGIIYINTSTKLQSFVSIDLNY